jgi:phenylalanyl-tRNA synthetase beta subunit
VWVQVGRRKTELMTALRAPLDATFDTIRTAQHTSRAVHVPTRQQFANLAGTDATATQRDLRHFACHKTELATDALEQFDVSFAVVTKREPLPQINLFRVQTIDDYIAKKISSTNPRKLFRETHHDRLFDSKHTKPFDLLIERLK